MPKIGDSFDHHLDYEIWMLVQTYEHLSKIAKPETEPERVSANAFIEAFCLHARLLLEFFIKDGRADQFTTNYTRLRREGRVDVWLTELNQQIAHLHPHGVRYIEPTNKIRAEMRLEINNRLSSELERFKAHLKPEYATLVQRQIPQFLDASPGVDTATNATMLSNVTD